MEYNHEKLLKSHIESIKKEIVEYKDLVKWVENNPDYLKHTKYLEHLKKLLMLYKYELKNGKKLILD